ncbi:antitoxin Xre/MbcA/ParS toxin-binding domain-containing protein [Lacibacterium aquatile]|uniref:Antitoxin Xre/MbcA/ParS toxin-binding domain-containing protein n=1 Tax=Lacibacterium aquatile TaxID=1168082 RepID=A0ABW5DS38_9PROT
MALSSIAHKGEGSVPIPVGLDAFTPMAEAWGLSTDEQIKLLGSPARSTFFKWKKEGGSLPRDTAERISHLFSIWKALQILFPDSRRADEWLKRSNTYFQNASALDVMLEGSFASLVHVRQYIDAQRGG